MRKVSSWGRLSAPPHEIVELSDRDTIAVAGVVTYPEGQLHSPNGRPFWRAVMGGTGAYLGARLARAEADVVLFARGAHLKAMQERGLRVISPDGDFEVRPQVTGDLASVGSADVIVLGGGLSNIERLYTSIPAQWGAAVFGCDRQPGQAVPAASPVRTSLRRAQHGDASGVRGAAWLGAGILLNGIAGGAYIGAGLGPGPRDGLMTGLCRRNGWPVVAWR